ncbi:MAG: SPOR domain-containing protein [Spirochaetota bacterium]|nr:SPOR domain-containing protein [Spirochaetota bacterium]
MVNDKDMGNMKIKEKNFYLLHLDIPRIIIISCVLVGIMIASFLIGININNEGNNNDLFSEEDSLFKIPVENNNNFLENNSIPSPLEGEIVNKNVLEDEKAPLLGKNEILQFNDIKDDEPSMVEKEKNLLTIPAKNISKDVTPPVKGVTKTAEKKHKITKRKKSSPKKKKRKRSKVLEASSTKKKPPVVKTDQSHYVIQVASFDKKFKAISESRNLEKLRYDAFIENSRVNGKKYYRVRIGPIFSKKKAINMLNGVQEIERYQDSYMIKN